MRVEALDYELPSELIAQQPLPERDGARLLVMSRSDAKASHHALRDLPSLLPKSLFVFNDTRVIPARLRGLRESGGKVEILLVERLSAVGAEELWLCMGKPLKSLRQGSVLRFGALSATIGVRRDEMTIEVTLSAAQDVASVAAALDLVGELPLPPYITRTVEAADRERYQTVFAREPGAIAAPTAGLHFGTSMLAALDAAGHTCAFVTLHVGPGTFLPLNVDNLAEHPMHAERYHVSPETAHAISEAKREGRPVVAVGTTVVRTLESAVAEDGSLRTGWGSSRLCIYPPYTFRLVDALVTNFHLPRSTLLALVMAFAGEENTRTAYVEAVRARYRFFSYGDAMLVRS